MNGHDYLNELPELFKIKIDKEFGSIDALYNMIFKQITLKYKLCISNPLDFEIKRKRYDLKISKINTKLHNMGFDGINIISNIIDDFALTIKQIHVKKLGLDLKSDKENFNSMSKWIDLNLKNF